MLAASARIATRSNPIRGLLESTDRQADRGACRFAFIGGRRDLQLIGAISGQDGFRTGAAVLAGGLGRLDVLLIEVHTAWDGFVLAFSGWARDRRLNCRPQTMILEFGARDDLPCASPSGPAESNKRHHRPPDRRPVATSRLQRSLRPLDGVMDAAGLILLIAR